MSEFWLYFNLGLEHVLDWNAYDHILFLIVLVAAYSFSSWRRVLSLVTIFFLGHTVALFLSVYQVVSISSKWIELLIAVTILVTALFNLFTAKRKEKQLNAGLLYFSTGFFGLIHGFGFSTFFKMVAGNQETKFLPLIEFALGIEAALIIVAFVVLLFSFIFQNFFRVSRRDWIIVTSSIVIGVILPILRENIQPFL
ncbi:HupE/UreJ family protein [Antarcticibacterium flavum]|uniref:HupE/UreJ family protein n=1 Tax=Antarcticibacterium flavum TaxID=2058175 RepID=A0A5B7X1E7_9FLAO|nr:MULTISPECIES: HupE/UreJ family protein [Antarcticibacterium]MCM4161336.1 HupE / UreJ protein [Antarcticibacterium sp. W02-3]QCY69414.1 HupE/UreJ family protein [Antarcticibacterium flavum]